MFRSLTTKNRRQRRKKLSRNRARRGIVILIVLTLLFMFVLISVTYVMIASRYRVAAENYVKFETVGDNPRQEVGEAINMLIRGSSDPSSPLHLNSILEDIFGNRSEAVTINWAEDVTDAIDVTRLTAPLTASTTPQTYMGLVALQFANTLRDGEHQYNGRVITLLQGPGRECSSRIVSSDLDQTGGKPQVLYCLPFRDSFGSIVPVSSTGTTGNVNETFMRPKLNGSQQNITAIINGREFSGTGAGFNQSTGLLDAGGSNDWEKIALWINGRIDPNNAGGANEPYDAPDYQNIFLSYYDLSAGSLTDNLATTPTQQYAWQRVKPAFHDIAVLNYMKDPGRLPSTALTDTRFQIRPISIAPSSSDPAGMNPQFTGSNPAGFFDPINGPWDVDNDMDGIPDSIWIDPGFPVMITKDGRFYKRLVAYLVLDLDGRVNLNAAGSTDQIAGYSDLISMAAALPNTITFGAPLAGTPAAGTPPTDFRLPRGSGIGPADINPLYAGIGGFTSTVGTGGDYLFRGRTTGTPPLTGRYGAGAAGDRAGLTVGTANWVMQMKLFPFGTTAPATSPDSSDHYYSIQGTYAALSTAPRLRNYAGGPLDLWGHFASGLDYNGNLVYQGMPSIANYSAMNSPYELDLSLRAKSGLDANASFLVDNPFSAGELERLLRSTDSDAYSLPNRIDALSQGDVSLSTLGVSVNSSNNFSYPLNPLRHAVTTASFDTPVASSLWGKRYLVGNNLITNTQHNQSLIDVLNSLMSSSAFWTPAPAAQQPALRKFLLPPEVLRGLPMDLNRKFGDGRDEENSTNMMTTNPRGNGIVDEESEVADRATNTALEVQDQSSLNSTGATLHAKTNIQLNLLQGSKLEPTGTTSLTTGQNYLARQQTARYLYTLMMMAKELGFVFQTTETGLSPEQQQELTARRIAQWAINAVEFMDADNIMTPFEYDVNPFDGWDPKADGIIEPAEADRAAAPYQRRLVWGVEQPMLLLSEAVVWHDKRVRDSKNDEGPGNYLFEASTPTVPKDPDMDQALIPRGPAFVELQACFNPLQRFAGNDFFSYDRANGLWRLDLGKYIPDNAGATTGVPVWRIVVTKKPTAANLSVIQQATVEKPDTFVAQTPQSTLAANAGYSSTSILSGVTATPLEIDRIIVFTPSAQLSADATKIPQDDKDRMYCLNNSAPAPAGNVQIFDGKFTPQSSSYENQLLTGGQYLMLYPNGAGAAKLDNGTVAKFYVGGKPDAATATTTALPTGAPSNQYLEIDTTPANANLFLNTTAPTAANFPVKMHKLADGAVHDVYASRVDGKASAPALMPIQSVMPAVTTDMGRAWAATDFAPLSFTEPLPAKYYPKPSEQNPLNDNLVEAYGEPNESGATAPTKKYIDKPLDSVSGTPLETDGYLKTGTYQDAKTLILQRVADPTRPYDPLNNPYITVDWLTTDLTVFNGDDQKPTNYRDEPTTAYASTWDPEDPNWATPTVPTFSSRQRGVGTLGAQRNYLWNSNSYSGISATLNGPVTPPTRGTDLSLGNFPYEFDPNQTLGFVNKTFGNPIGDAGITAPTAQLALSAATTAKVLYRGSPSVPGANASDPPIPTPFPNLTWNNRPFNNAFELMRVPASDPGRLTSEFAVDASPTVQYYVQAADSPAIVAAKERLPFGHLINFFHSKTATGGTPTSANFARIFDWVTTPSKFMGTETWLTPPNVGSAAPGTIPTVATPGMFSDNPITGLGLLPFQTPYNYVSNYREPGKINLNTLSHPKVFKALMNGWITDSTGRDLSIPDTDPANTVAYSDSLFYKFLQSRNRIDVAMANPLELGKVLDPTYATLPTLWENPFRPSAMSELVPISGMTKTGVETTILRTLDPTNPNARPMFSPVAKTTAYNSTAINAVTNFQPIERLANLTTNKSNVYAIWVTVGYFEVTRSPDMTSANTALRDAARAKYPDGYILGQELGLETGEVSRHRGFALFDRSIPVGFERGQDHNIDRGFLIKRFIE